MSEYQYFWLGKIGHCAMQGNHKKGLGRCFRHAGQWGVDFIVKADGTFWTADNESPVDHLNGLQLFECTEAEWRKDNGHYAPGNQDPTPCPKCGGVIEAQNSGIKCTSCNYWFCY